MGAPPLSQGVDRQWGRPYRPRAADVGSRGHGTFRCLNVGLQRHTVRGVRRRSMQGQRHTRRCWPRGRPLGGPRHPALRSTRFDRCFGNRVIPRSAAIRKGRPRGLRRGESDPACAARWDPPRRCSMASCPSMSRRFARKPPVCALVKGCRGSSTPSSARSCAAASSRAASPGSGAMPAGPIGSWRSRARGAASVRVAAAMGDHIVVPNKQDGWRTGHVHPSVAHQVRASSRGIPVPCERTIGRRWF